MRRSAIAFTSLAIACSSGAADVQSNPPVDASASNSDAAALADAGAGAPEAGADEGATDAASACAQYLGAGLPSAWVYPGPDGHLKYAPLSASGDTIMDFSSAGYMGGGVALPVVPARKTIGPSGGDDTAAIQAAIDAVSAMPLQGGVRGAVVLQAGNYALAGTLRIAASGVVLRGSGTGASGTILTAEGQTDFVLRIAGSGNPTAGDSSPITDTYVPSGASTFHVADGSKFSPGDMVLVQRPVTSAWVTFMGMDTLVRDGSAQTWIAPGTLHEWDRSVTAVNGNAITIDAPISDSIDAKYITGAALAKYTYPGRISQVGLEHLEFHAPVRSASSELSLVRVDAVLDGFLRDVVDHNFTQGFWLGGGVKQFTVADVAVTHDPTTYVTSEAPFDFWIDGEQTLVLRSSSSGGNKIWYYATQDHTRGPNVLLDFQATGTASHVTGHQRWATGALVDNATVTGGVTFGNNGDLGSGEGWSMGWGVIWNSTTDIGVMAPPGGMNWAIGNTGKELDTTVTVGTYESMNTPVAIGSLYRAQLCERLGSAAVTAIAN
jgi:hypothetical protein